MIKEDCFKHDGATILCLPVERKVKFSIVS